MGKCKHHVRNSYDFVQVLDELNIEPEYIMVSFDVVPLFTKMPIMDTTKLLATMFPPDIITLFKHILMTTYFVYEGVYYEQTDVVAIGPLLSPVIANFYM